ncbi:MAG TPA: VOC family protein [Gemmatimonadaceae bacterium]|nr:VOC family protein [Gemmatimonadaceae bacterium]
MSDRVGIAPPGFRLPDETHIGRVRLQVGNLGLSVSYYETVLGMRVLKSTDTTAELGPHGEDRVLIELTEKKGVRTVPRRGLLGLYHFAVLLPDRAALGRFVAHLSEIGAYAGMSDHLVSEAVYLTDPDGLGIEVYCDRPRESWTARDKQLEMTTKPLDVNSVIAAAGGEKWDGMPAGTKIGHVHFYVGDIDQAAAFYHAGLGLDKIVWNYPGALFMSAGGYHHHVGVNTWAAGASPASDDDARLLDWELLVPDSSAVDAAAKSIGDAGFEVSRDGDAVVARDGWGIRLRLRPTA